LLYTDSCGIIQDKGILCLDRDGVIIKEKNYLNDPDEIDFIEGSISALRDILDNHFFVAIISNQAGIAKGLITHDEFNLVNDRFIKLLKINEVFINCIIYCPYHPDGILPEFSKKSLYRKPDIGMYGFIKRYYHLRNRNIYMVGDKKLILSLVKKLMQNALLLILDTELWIKIESYLSILMYYLLEI
jgi:D-glycero-D-manno-heptose 1,7-bisphosphate phosphatase